MHPVLAKAMDVILIIHADHEQNASTTTVRTAGSSLASPFACIAAGIASLWGPAHGGANEAVIHMLQDIGTVDKIPEFVARAKDPKDPFRLMGFGHRVYKNYDPRATIMQKMCHQVLAKTGLDDPLLKLAMRLEEVALALHVQEAKYTELGSAAALNDPHLGFLSALGGPFTAPGSDHIRSKKAPAGPQGCACGYKKSCSRATVCGALPGLSPSTVAHRYRADRTVLISC